VLRAYHGTKTKGIIELAQKFKQKYRLDSIAYQPLKQGYKNVLFVDSLGIYTKGGQQSVVVLRQSPKIPLDDLIDSLQPSMIVADGSNYPSFIKRWEKTCAMRNIAFHATIQQGAYPLN
jgi:competence protein ComEC